MLSKEEIRALKRAHPVADVVAGYGIQLRRSGRSLVGRCPFHHDQGRPNFNVCCPTDQADDFFYCFRCGVGGDVIRFVRLIDGLSFGQAIERLNGTATAPPGQRKITVLRRPIRKAAPWGIAERACLSAAVTLYHNSLLDNAPALAYLRGRGIGSDTIERCRVGHARGDELCRYLAWRRLPLKAAFRVGLLKPGGRETFAGRVVVPEIRATQPIWLIGRVLDPVGDQPKYLGLPGAGRKPLLGWENAVDEPSPVVVESVFDWLTLVSWGIPGLALLGTRVRPRVLNSLSRFSHFYLALNSDQAGRKATELLINTFGQRATPIELPGVKDISELAPMPNGRSLFLQAMGRWQLHAAA